MIKRSIKHFIASDEQSMVVLIDENIIPLFYPKVGSVQYQRVLI